MVSSRTFKLVTVGGKAPTKKLQAGRYHGAPGAAGRKAFGAVMGGRTKTRKTGTKTITIEEITQGSAGKRFTYKGTMKKT